MPALIPEFFVIEEFSRNAFCMYFHELYHIKPDQSRPFIAEIDFAVKIEAEKGPSK